MQNATTQSAQPHLFRRGSAYLLYGASVLALSLATFGVVGILPGILVSAFWLTVYCSRHRPTALLYASTAAAAVCGLACCLIPAMAATDEPARRAECRANLRSLRLAVHNYHDVYGSFPPAYTTDETGRRLHSWRVLLLPFVDQGPLYDRIDQREPWDGPRNREVLHRMPHEFACPMTNFGDNCTSYLAVAGDGGVWPGTGTTAIPEIHDGPDQTILLVECLSDIHWAEPRDLDLDEAARLLESSEARDIHGKWHWKDTILYEYLHGGHVLFADGEVRFAPGGTDQSTWRGLLTIDDALPGQDWDRIAANSFQVRRLRIGNCLRLAAFVVLALLPLLWVWDNRRAGREQQSRAGRKSNSADMADSLVAVVVSVPEEHFPDDDDVCLTAGRFVCGQLESHLIQHGHSIPNWILGGCDEDWGVYFESRLHATTFEYRICFFSAPPDTTQYQMLIQYHVRLPFIKRLFGMPAEVVPGHHQ